MKIAVVFTILLLVLLPAMSVVMTGDGTTKGRVQCFVSYGLSLSSFLLCLLTIVVSIYSVTSDFQNKQIYTVLTKPVRRFQLLLGKLLGVILLDVVLLGLFSAVIYSITVYIPRFLDSDQAELQQLKNEFFTARAALPAPEVDVSLDVERLYKQLEQTHQLPEELAYSSRARENYKKALAKRVKLSKRAAAPGQELVWEFDNVRPLELEQSFFIRFKYDVSVNPPDLQVNSQWLVGDIRQIRFGQKMRTPIYSFDRKDLIRTFYEIEVPADAVAEDGFLAVVFLNPPQFNDTTVIFPPRDGLEVLYKADTFAANFIRAALLVLLRLVFLACLGILASTFLSLPVAVLFCLVIFFTGTVSGFVIESFDFLSEAVTSVYSFTIKPVVRILPQFDKYSPTDFLVFSRLLSWAFLAKAAGVMVGIKAVLLMIAAVLIFNRREIARVSV